MSRSLKTSPEYSFKQHGNDSIGAFFKVRDFRCKDGSDKILIDPRLGDLLNRIRAHFNASVTINSAYRTPSWNARQGGAKNSYHKTGQAADIVVEGKSPSAVARAAETLGAPGVIRYKTFTHVDVRGGKLRAEDSGGNFQKVSGFGGGNPIAVAQQSEIVEELELMPEVWETPIRDVKGVLTSPIIDTSDITGGDLEVFLEDRENGGKVFKLSVLDGATLAHKSDLTPSVFKFEVLDINRDMNFAEGNAVLVKDHGIAIFRGYVFSHEFDETGIVKVTAYDQIRYLQYQDTYCYENQSAGDILNKWAVYFALKTGIVETDSYRIIKRDEWSKSIKEMLDFAITQTIVKTGQILTLYDDAGTLNLRYANDLWFFDYFIRLNDAESYRITNSIDDDTYNQVKLVYKNADTGTLEIYQAHDIDNIKKWGLLQYYEEVQDQPRAQAYANQMLQSKNLVRNSMTLRGVPAISTGHIRAGYTVMAIPVQSDNRYIPLRVPSITHTWTKNNHLMDMSLYLG